MWFFSNVKAVLGAAAGISVAIFFFIFKARGKEIEEQKEEIKELKREEEVKSKIKEVSKDVEETFDEEEREIEETYNEREGFVYKTTNKPLTPTLLSKLRDTQGLSNRSDNSPE